MDRIKKAAVDFYLDQKAIGKQMGDGIADHQDQSRQRVSEAIQKAQEATDAEAKRKENKLNEYNQSNN